MKKYQAGFTAIEVVLVVLLLAAIGAAGYFAYAAHGSKTSNSTAKSESPSPSSSTRPSTSQAASGNPSVAATPVVNYLAITQFGVKFAVPSGVGKLTYTIDSNGIAQFDNGVCPTGNGPGTMGGLVRGTKPFSTSEYGAHEATAHVGAYYYYYASPEQACSADAGVANQQTSDWSLMQQAIATLQGI